jgi:uncharacterized Zn finger protein
MPTHALSVQIECPQCKAHSVFHRAAFPHFDSSGFESYSIKCQNCGTFLVGIIDPFDDKLLLSVDGEANVKAVPDNQKVH